MFNICLYGIDLRRRENIPSFSFKLVFLGDKGTINGLYYKVIPRTKRERFNSVSKITPVVLNEKRFYYFEFVGSESTMRSFLENLSGYKLVTGNTLLVNSCDLDADMAFNKRREITSVDRVLVGSRFEDIRDILKQFSVSTGVAEFIAEKGFCDEHRLVNIL